MWGLVGKPNKQETHFEVHLGRKSEPELTNRNHPSRFQAARSREPTAGVPGRLTENLPVGGEGTETQLGWMPLGIHHTLHWQPHGRMEKKTHGSTLEWGKEVAFSCSVPNTLYWQSICMHLASCKREMLIGVSYITEQAVKGAKRQ